MRTVGRYLLFCFHEGAARHFLAILSHLRMSLCINNLPGGQPSPARFLRAPSNFALMAPPRTNGEESSFPYTPDRATLPSRQARELFFLVVFFFLFFDYKVIGH